MTDFLHLSQQLNQHQEFRAILTTLHPGRLSEEKKTLLQSLSPRVEMFLGKDKVALEAWGEFMGSVKEGYIFPLTPTRRQVITATLLAGAAIKKPELQLRPGLLADVYQARADFLKVDVSVPTSQPSVPGGLFRPRPSLETPELARYRKLVSNYDILTKRMTTGGKLDSAIRTLLTDQSKSLAPLGSMRTLDSSTIENAQKNTIFAKATARALPTYVEALKPATVYAPKRLALSLNKFRCVRQQEKAGTDEIFWGGSFVRCTNLAEIYAQIEQMLNQQNPSSYDLDFHWSFSSFLKPVGGGLFKTNSNSPWFDFSPNSIVFEQEIFKGFGPWAGVLFCIEDDDAEYKAVSEVIDTVGDYADAVGQTASIVSVAAAAGGVTGPVAVAAGAVSTAASVVSLSADIAGAAVDIVNFFDTDDMIDSVNFSGESDYVALAPALVKQGTEVQPLYDLQESSGAGHYQIELGTTYSGLSEPFERTWGCKVIENRFPADGDWYEKKGGMFGDKGEIEKTVNYGTPVDILEAFDVEKKESDPGNAYVMKDYPKLDPSKTVGRVKVHWGVPAFKSFKFQICLQAFLFDKIKRL